MESFKEVTADIRTLKQVRDKYPNLYQYAIADEDGVIAYFLNKDLAEKQKIGWGDLNILKLLHRERIVLIELMEGMDPKEDKKNLYECHKEWTELAFKIQEAWGFGRDAGFHKFWKLPHCICDKTSNEKSYGIDARSISSNCYHVVEFFELEEKVIKDEESKEFNDFCKKKEFSDFCEKEEFVDFVDKQSPVQSYKPSLGYKLEKVKDVLLIGVSVAFFALSLYFLVTNQIAMHEMAKYIIGD